MNSLIFIQLHNYNYNVPIYIYLHLSHKMIKDPALLGAQVGGDNQLQLEPPRSLPLKNQLQLGQFGQLLTHLGLFENQPPLLILLGPLKNQPQNLPLLTLLGPLEHQPLLTLLGPLKNQPQNLQLFLLGPLKNQPQWSLNIPPLRT